MAKLRLWRVDAIHSDGYHAPYLLVETEKDRKYDAEAEALKKAKKESRLSDFDCWYFIANKLDKKKLDSKWYDEDEFLYKITKRNKKK